MERDTRVELVVTLQRPLPSRSARRFATRLSTRRSAASLPSALVSRPQPTTSSGRPIRRTGGEPASRQELRGRTGRTLPAAAMSERKRIFSRPQTELTPSIIRKLPNNENATQRSVKESSRSACRCRKQASVARPATFLRMSEALAPTSESWYTLNAFASYVKADSSGSELRVAFLLAT
jgi:hypothetical protein